jgi:hypothetical protein
MSPLHLPEEKPVLSGSGERVDELSLQTRGYSTGPVLAQTPAVAWPAQTAHPQEDFIAAPPPPAFGFDEPPLGMQVRPPTPTVKPLPEHLGSLGGLMGGAQLAPPASPQGFAGLNNPQLRAPYAAVPVLPQTSNVVLSLEQLACIQAELDIDEGRKQGVLTSNGVDEASYWAQCSQLQSELAADPVKAARFNQLREYYRAILGG